MHLWAKERAPGQQLTLDAMWMGELTEFTRASVGLCSPGHKLIRHFFLAVYNVGKEYKLSWRQQNVPVNVGAVDATMKRGSALTDLKIRQTFWSNDANAPLVAVFVNSASMDDPAFKAACIDYNGAVHLLGMSAVQLLYLDCPFRDGPGAMRRWPSLQYGAVSPISFVEDGELTVPTTVAELEEWLQPFDSYPASDLEFGLDVEWRAHVQGIRADTLQLVHLGRNGAKPRGAFIPLNKIGQLSPRLVALLQKSVLGGVKVNGDLKRLSTVYPAAGFHHHDSDPIPSTLVQDNIIDLAELAASVLRSAPNSLAGVFGRCCPGRSLNKALVDVKQVHWDEWPLNDGEAINYGMNDAYASALALRRLRHPTRFTMPLPPPPPPAPPAPRPQPPLRSYLAADDEPSDDDDASVSSLDEEESESGDDEAGEQLDGSDLEEELLEQEEQSDWAMRRIRRQLQQAGQELADGDGLGAFASLDAQLQADLMGACDAGGAAPLMSEEDELEADDREHGAGAAVDASPSAVRPAVRITVLEAASELIKLWASSGDMQPLELPSCLTDGDREALHDFCQRHGIGHATFGEPGRRQLRVFRRPGAAAAAGAGGSSSADAPPATATSFAGDILSSLEFIESWVEVLIKYDPRHWMGNWFLMAQSKSSALFKCAFTAEHFARRPTPCTSTAEHQTASCPQVLLHGHVRRHVRGAPGRARADQEASPQALQARRHRRPAALVHALQRAAAG